jgi:hypothetical protein
VSAQESKVQRSIGPTGAVHAAALIARLAIEALEFGALAATAVIANFAGKILRRVNRRGLFGWGTVTLAVFLLTTLVIELLELV